MIIIYNFCLILTAVLLLPVIIIAMIVQPKFRAGFFKKCGFYDYKKSCDKTVVFHCVSVGETNALKPLILAYKEKHPNEKIVVTTTTKTGQEIAQKQFGNIAEKVTYFPFDFFFSVNSFLDTFNPEKIIIAETEIWPGLVTLAKSRGIKVYTVNGRISPSSYNGYKKISKLLKPVLDKYEKILMQTQSDAERIINTGANPDKVVVCGNLKFDISQNLTKEQIAEYKAEFKSENNRLFIAASTHSGEDEILINAFKKLKERFNDAKMIIAPRHPQRYDEVCSLLDVSGLKYGKRSQKDNFCEKDVILLDTMGELAKLYSVCHIAFIGGSFSATGGHNPLEANIWNKPVISGPSIFNFKDVYKIVTAKNCAVIVQDEANLTEELISFYENSDKYKTYCEKAKEVFDENRGAILKVLEII